MSKSMNKYHKCIQELGRSMSGWVEVGALAVGVGVGVGAVPVPGGGGMAWAGKYQVVLSQRDGGVCLECRDVETEKIDYVKFDTIGSSMGKCALPASDVVGKFVRKENKLRFSIGNFELIVTSSGKICVFDGSTDDSLCIEGANVSVGKEDEQKSLTADILSFANCGKIENYGKVYAKIFSVSNCRKLYNRFLSADLFVFCKTPVSSKEIRAGNVLKFPEDSKAIVEPLSCYQGECEVINEHKGERYKLDGFVEDLSGFFRHDDTFLEDYWSPYSSGLLPLGAKEGVQLETGEDESHYYVFPKPGRYLCVFFFNMCDGCGARHEKDVFVDVKDCSDMLVAKCMAHVGAGDAKLVQFLCHLELKDNARLRFFLRECNEKKCPSMVKKDPVAYFYRY